MNHSFEVSDGMLVYEQETGLMDHIRRKFPASLPWSLARLRDAFTIERLTANEMVLSRGPRGRPNRFTRVPEK